MQVIKYKSIYITVAPVFMEEKYKETIVLKVGSSTVLEFPFSAHPMPKVKWTFKKKALPASKRITQETIVGMTALTISKAVRKDSGTYSLTIENDFGKSTMSIKVIVIGEYNFAFNLYYMYQYKTHVHFY